MNGELHKRLKEAAEKYQEVYETTEMVAFTHGALWGYKEAIANMVQYLQRDYAYNASMAVHDKAFIADFETDMNKFLEE